MLVASVENNKPRIVMCNPKASSLFGLEKQSEFTQESLHSIETPILEI